METIKEKEKEKEQKLVLTPSQQRAFDQFKEFLEDDTKVFILKGYAGTGKTTLVKTFIEELEKRNETFKLLASTGRAAKIMRDKTVKEDDTTRDVKTIHSAIYTFTDLNQDLDEVYKDIDEVPKMDNTGQLLLMFSFDEVENQPYERCFYIVDEASMIGNMVEHNPSQAVFGSGKLLNDLLKYDSKGKFIFVGDDCQLPPVNEKLSPALSQNYISAEFGYSSVTAEMKQIVRQSGDNDIIKASHQIRKLKENPPYHSWSVWYTFPLRGYRNITICASQAEMLNRYIKDVKTNGYENATMISNTNKNSFLLSNLIRPALGMSDPLLAVNDLLLVTQNNLLTGLMNGDLVRVTQIGAMQEVAYLTFIQVEVEEIVTKRRFSQLLIADILHSGIVNLTPDQQKRLYIDYYFRMKKKGVSQKSQKFKDGMYNDIYLNALRATFGYAITCHKTQGGEWKNVYLNIPRILAKNTGSAEYQWLYTAMTRATDKLFINEDFFIADK
jgi:hypothetical protein